MNSLMGTSFGNLTVIEYAGIDKYHNNQWKCKCTCGNECVVKGYLLRNSHTKSCGCLRKTRAKQNFTTHGLRKHPLYTVWVDMRRRCDDTTDARYSDYGGRGITVCAEWYDFQNFYNWSILNGYNTGLTIDRINNDGNYAPKNCRWVDRYVQANNKRNNRKICINGETKNLFQWCREYNITPQRALTRMKSGWSEQDAITKPVRQHKRRKLV